MSVPAVVSQLLTHHLPVIVTAFALSLLYLAVSSKKQSDPIDTMPDGD